MCHNRFSRGSVSIFRLISRVPFGLPGGRCWLSVCEWDRILARVGTPGIPAEGEKAGFGTPGKSGRAVFAF